MIYIIIGHLKYNSLATYGIFLANNVNPAGLPNESKTIEQ